MANKIFRQVLCSERLPEKEEIWKDIPNYVGLYQVSTLGNIKSTHGKHGKNERILSPKKDRDGYLCVNLSLNKKLVDKSKEVGAFKADFTITKGLNFKVGLMSKT